MLAKRKPTTPSQRHTCLLKFRSIEELTTKTKKRFLIFYWKKNGGRNNNGRITVWHKVGGHKKLYRNIDFKWIKRSFNIVKSIEYDPNWNVHIALVENTETKELSYILAPEGLQLKEIISSHIQKEFGNLGCCEKIKHLKVGTFIHNIELYPGKGGQLIWAAGTFAQIIQKEDSKKYSWVLLSSGEIWFINQQCCATVGILSNREHYSQNLGKAGRSFWLGRRPSVRGVAMNPVDHPHGGGQGKTSGGRPSVTPWGFITKGWKTKKKKNWFRLKLR